MNKVDLMDAQSLAQAENLVMRELRPGVRMIKARHGAIDPAVLLGLSAAAEDDLEARPSHHDNGADHDHDDFHSFSVEMPECASPAELLARLLPVIEAHGILRVKGFAAVAGKEMRLVFQGVGRRLQHYYDRAWENTESRRTRLVVIGERGLDETAIRAALAG